MSRRYRTRRSTCARKRLFRSLTDARVAAEKINRTPGRTMKAYRCNACRFYHLTSTGEATP